MKEKLLDRPVETEAVDVQENDEIVTPHDVIVSTQGDLNKALNMQIGHSLRAADYDPDVFHLERARDTARLAEELGKLSAGEIGADDLSEQAKTALEDGLTFDDLMNLAKDHVSQQKEHATERGKELEYVKPLQKARDEYVSALMARKKLFNRKEQQADLEAAEEAYNEAFMAKIEALLAMDPTHRKAPYVSEVMDNLGRDDGVTLESLSENHMHVLVDQLAREQTKKTEQIEGLTGKGAKRVLATLKKSRPLRVVIGGALWAGSTIAANKGLLPEGGAQAVGDVFDHILPLVAGYVTSREVFKGIDGGITRRIEARKNSKDLDQIASDSELTDLTLRSVYSGIEYQDGRIEDRQVGETKTENLDVLGKINDEYKQLEEEESRLRSHGVTYDAETALKYTSELYLRKKDKIDAIVSAENPKEAYLDLCREMISEDTHRLTEKQKTSKAKRALFRALSVCTTAFAGQWIGQISSVQGATNKPASMLKVELS